MERQLTVLVTGATGKQGNALARRLLARKHKVRAFTRDPGSRAARELERAGAQIVRGSFDDAGSMERAARGVDAVFAMATPYGPGGAEAEVEQGRALAAAAKAAGVPHLVYSSVANADRDTGIPHFDSKLEIERHIRTLGVPFTIVAPVFFMDNFTSPMMLPGLRNGKLAAPLPATRKLQQIALSDIAAFTTLVIERREQFFGQRIDIASDERSGAETVDVLSGPTKKKLQYSEIPLAHVRAGNQDLAKMFEWFDRVGYSTDIEALRRDHPEVGWHTLASWAAEQDWQKLLEDRDDLD
jgi:uncharacterized protein YbjT (DUF2867 family)